MKMNFPLNTFTTSLGKSREVNLFFISSSERFKDFNVLMYVFGKASLYPYYKVYDLIHFKIQVSKNIKPSYFKVLQL